MGTQNKNGGPTEVDRLWALQRPVRRLHRLGGEKMRVSIRTLVVAGVICLFGGCANGQMGQRSQARLPFARNATGNFKSVICSPAPCVLPPTQVSDESNQVTDAPIAADPLNPKHLVVGSYDLNCRYAGFHSSLDGGLTWDLHCMPAINEPQGEYVPGGQPMVGYDSDGVAYIGDEYGVSEAGTGLVAIQKSSDGVSWSTPEIALGPGNETEYFYASLAVDANTESPYANNLYVSAVALDEPYQDKNRVVVSHSSDGGMTWKAVAVAPVQIAPDIDNYTNMAISKDGTVYLTWMYCNSGFYFCEDDFGYMVFSKSSDGGNTWSAPALMTTVVLNHESIPNTNTSAENYPAIGVDNGDGPHSGNLYVVMYTWTGSYLRVQVIHSTDGGNTWSRPVPVAPDSDDHDQFLPWISVSPAGLVGVSWLDRRNDPANIDYQAFATISADGGLSFQPDVQLTAGFSNPNDNDGSLGNYAGNAWDGPNYFVAAWMDNSNTEFLQDVVGGIRLK